MSDRRQEVRTDRTSTTRPKSVAACPSEEELAVLLDASAAAELVPRLLAHLDVCDDCRNVAAALARTTGDQLATATSLPVAPRVEPGSAVDRYVVLHRLGAGGMGTVYAAYDPVLDRKVAIKFVRASPHEPEDVRVAEAQRVAREALTLARLSHPNIVAVFDAGYYDELAYIVMEHIDGYTLRGWLEAGRRSSGEIARVIGEAAAGLRAIHGAGLVHRDMKPENVMVDTAGRVHVADFGLARGSALEANEPAELAGTVPYMSPEQLRGERADALSDVFSFGVTAYEALYDTRPFPHARTPNELLAAIRDGKPERGRRRNDVPRSLARAVLKCLSFESAPRQGALTDVASSLSFALPRRVVALGVVGVVAVLGMGVLFGERRAAHASLCQGGASKLAGVWDDEHQRAVATAFDALVDVPFAPATGRTVVHELDAYGAGWVKAYTQACEATRLRGEQSEVALDRQMACLEGRRKELEVVASALALPSATSARYAIQSVDALAGVESCLDVTELARRGELAPGYGRRPLDGALAELRGRLALRWYNADVRRDLETALATARELHDPFAEGSALTMLAELQGHAGDLAGAETSLRDAVLASERGGDPSAGTVAWTSLVELAGHDQVHASEAARDAEHAEALLSRVNAPLLRAKLVRARADTALEESRFEAAAALYRQALDLLTANGKGESLDAAACLDGLGWVLGEGGKPAEGRVAASSSLAMSERLFGPSSPVVASGLANLARIDASEEHYADAEARLTRALEIYRALGESEHGHIANITNSLAEVDAATGRLDEARARFEENAVRYRREVGDHRFTALSVANVAGVDLTQKKYEDASRGFHEARAILLRAGSTDPNVEAQVSVGIGRAEMGLGHPVAAREAIERALVIYDSGSFGPAEHGGACLAMAHVAVATGDRVRARALTEKARDLYRSVPAHASELAEADELLSKLARVDSPEK